jgi:antitoxin ParD1/3/4
MRTNKSITLTLGKQQQVLDSFVAQAITNRPAMRCRPRSAPWRGKKVALDEIMRTKIREAVDDRRPGVPAARAFADLRVRHAEQLRAHEDEA